VHFGAFCSYQMLWDKLVAIVAYNFGGLVFKSLVVEAHKHVYQRPMNDLDFEVQKYCECFLLLLLKTLCQKCLVLQNIQGLIIV
jgi:hypothetical protein